ncbi:MAG: phage tail protein [Syntrophobacteraceae bacterium]
MRDDISLSIIEHPFRRDMRETVPLPFMAGVSLRKLRNERFSSDAPVVIYLNGGLVPEGKWDVTFPSPGDYVMLTAALAGGGDGMKTIFRVVLMIAITAAAMFVGQGWLGLAGWKLMAFVGGVALAGGLIVNALIPPSQPQVARDSTLDSQAYSWAPGNTEGQGVPVAKWYGLHRIYGNIIGSYIENRGKDQVQNALVCLGLGPIDSLANFKLNDQPCQNFKEVEIQTRYGFLDQAAPSNFQNTKVEYPSSVEVIHGSPYTYVTVGTDFDMIEVDIAFPQGLWQAVSGDSNLHPWSVELLIEVRKVGAPAWKDITARPGEPYLYPRFGYDEGCNPPRWSKGKYVTIDGTSLWWDHEPGAADYSAHHEGEGAGRDPSLAWHWLGPVPEEYRSGDDSADFVETAVQSESGEPSDRIKFRDSVSVPIRHTFSYAAPDDEKGRHEVRITRLTTNQDLATIGDRSYFAGVREVLCDKLQYPRHVLVSIKAKANDQLSGSFRFSCTGKMAIVQVWDGLTHAGAQLIHTAGSSATATTTGDGFAQLAAGDEIIAAGMHRRIVQKVGANEVVLHEPVDWDNFGQGQLFQWRHWALEWSDNPAWAAFDVFTQPVIAGEGAEASPFAVVRFDGLDPARIDLVKFKEWADYCDELVPDGFGGTEKRVTFNGGFDFDSSMWEAGLRVCQVGRAVPVWNGVHLTLAIDKPADPVNLYTVGNIEESRFKEIFLPVEERATQIEIDYTNLDNDYQRDKLTVYRPDVPGGEYRASLDLFGITKPSEAWRAGMYRLNCNRYILRSAEIDVDIEALNAQLGDVVYIQHDVPRWGSGGRIVSAAPGLVTLDKEVTIEDGLSYQLLLRLAEDVVHELEVTDGPGTHQVLSVSPAFDSSAEFDAAGPYQAGNRVKFAGRIYECIQETSPPSPAPPDENYWRLTSNCPLPERFDVYAFGQVASIARRFRITDIAKSQDQKVTLSLTEYRPEIYEYEEVEPPVNDRAQARLKRMEPRDVVLSQNKIMGPEGRVSGAISIAFTRSSNAAYRHVEIWCARESGGGRNGWEWLYSGATSGSSFDIAPVEFQQRYAVILIPVDASGNKLYHGRATLHDLFLRGPSRAADLHYANVNGTSRLHTSGASATVTTENGAFEFVGAGSRIAANLEMRTVAQKVDNNTLVVDSAVDWDNGGAGWPFTYDARIDALMPAERDSTKGAVVGGNLVREDGSTVITEANLWGPDLPDFSPEQAGLFLTHLFMGYHDGNAWAAYIGSDGKFHFRGNAANYIHWDGEALTIKGELDADDIKAGTIHADRISANSITTGKLGEDSCTGKAKVTDDEVEIVDQSDWETVLSLVLTLEVGSWVLIQASVDSHNSTSGYARYRLRRGGAVLKTIPVDNEQGFPDWQPMQIVFLDTPGASGSITYDIQAICGPAPRTMIYHNLSLGAIELKR